VKHTLHEAPGLYLEALSVIGHCPQPLLVLKRTLLEKAGHSSRALKATDRDILEWKAASLMEKSWFYQESGTLLLDEYIVEMDP
jgi:hypothetical protein